MDEDVWRLPGPTRLVVDTVREVSRGRHTAVVLPTILSEDEEFVAGLSAALNAALWAANESPQLVATDEEDGGPLLWLADALNVVGGTLTTTRLLDEPEAAGRTAVLDCTPLHPKHRQEVCSTVTRLVSQSRPRKAEDRPRILLICTRDVLPRFGADYADVTFEPIWWWGRLSRWDVAARIQQAVEAQSEPGVLRELRLETLIEVCRWDVRLAVHLAEQWEGDPQTLPGLISEAVRAAPRTTLPARMPRNSGRWPVGILADLWDAGAVDLWHDECLPSIRGAGVATNAVSQAIWAAQARVLLPWIESRRRDVAAELLRAYGKAAVASVIELESDVIEVGPLFVAVKTLAAHKRPALRDAVYRLWQARNKLAHLRVLSAEEQRDLIIAFAGLGFAS